METKYSKLCAWLAEGLCFGAIGDMLSGKRGDGLMRGSEGAHKVFAA